VNFLEGERASRLSKWSEYMRHYRTVCRKEWKDQHGCLCARTIFLNLHLKYWLFLSFFLYIFSTHIILHLCPRTYYLYTYLIYVSINFPSYILFSTDANDWRGQNHPVLGAVTFQGRVPCVRTVAVGSLTKGRNLAARTLRDSFDGVAETYKKIRPFRGE